MPLKFLLLLSILITLISAQGSFPCHPTKPIYNTEVTCSRVELPPQLCKRCSIRPTTIRGKFELCDRIFDTESPECHQALQEYVNLNEYCDPVRTEALPKMLAGDDAARKVIDYFLYSICEQCCDCVPMGVEKEDHVSLAQDHTSSNPTLWAEHRGNCPAHAHFDVCKVVPNVEYFAKPGDPIQEGVQKACPMLRDWIRSDEGLEWDTNPNTNIQTDLRTFLRGMLVAIDCSDFTIWEKCYDLESKQNHLSLPNSVAEPEENTEEVLTEPPTTTVVTETVTEAVSPVTTSTTSSPDTTVPPVDTTVPPVDTTAAPVDTTTAPVETTVAPGETTVAPVEAPVATASTTPSSVTSTSYTTSTTIPTYTSTTTMDSSSSPHTFSEIPTISTATIATTISTDTTQTTTQTTTPSTTPTETSSTINPTDTTIISASSTSAIDTTGTTDIIPTTTDSPTATIAETDNSTATTSAVSTSATNTSEPAQSLPATPSQNISNSEEEGTNTDSDFPITTPMEPSPKPDTATDSGSTCFPASALVQLASGKFLPMSQVRIGDSVRVNRDTFSEVFLFSHRTNYVSAPSYIQIVTDITNQTLIVTPGHLLGVNGGFVSAELVVQGDRIEHADYGWATVSAVTQVQDRGLFNPQTLHGDIVVNGFVASTYTTGVPRKLAAGLLQPMRLLYKLGLVNEERFGRFLEHGVQSMGLRMHSGEL